MRKEILKGIVGSKAYGLDTPESDTDYRGVYIYDTISLCDLSPTKDNIRIGEDVTYELDKFCRLSLRCNPNIMEVLWLDDYTVKEPEGEQLIEIRKTFLSTNHIRNAYGGYALSQVKRLERRGDSFSADTRKRTQKHARHMFRLLLQGKSLLETGGLKVRLTKEEREYCFEWSQVPPEIMVPAFYKGVEEFNNTESVLPDEPDFDTVNNVVRAIRRKWAR